MACSGGSLDGPTVHINEVMPVNTAGLQDEEEVAHDWIELHNPTERAISLKGFGLSDTKSRPFKWTFPAMHLQPGGYVTVFASSRDQKDRTRPLHTNFKLKSKDETIFLTHPGGILVDQVVLTGVPANVSYGRDPQNPNQWLYFHETTPDEANASTGWSSTRVQAPSGHPTLNEILANNRYFSVDEEGDPSDWIEVANPTDTPISLAGYTLSDDFENPARWTFPEKTLGPGEHLVVYASGKDHASPHLHTNFKLKAPKESVVLASPDGEILETVQLVDLDADVSYGRDADARETWVVFAKPTPGQPNQSQGRASDATSPPHPIQDVFISEAMALNTRTQKSEHREYADWVELHNRGETAVNLKGYGFSDQSDAPFKYRFGDLVMAAGETKLIWLSGRDCAPPACKSVHVPFGLNPWGETLTLVAPNGTYVDRFQTGQMGKDISSGRTPGKSRARVYFETPTPGEENAQRGLSGYAPSPIIETPGGFYEGAVRVPLSKTASGVIQRYTVDGSIPSQRSTPYTKPLRITQNAVLKVRSFANGLLPSPVVTQSYLFDAPSSLPTVSLSIDPETLFHPTYGLHMKGPNADPVFPHVGGNFWKKTEVPAHLELFENNGLSALDQDVGFRIFGAYSRAMPKKSFYLKARSKYGPKEFHYPLFPDKDHQSSRNFVLRQSGQDAFKTRFRDVLMTSLIADTGVDYQAHRAVVLYLNGDYWGLYNIREKINANFITENHGHHPDDVALLRANGAPDHGSNLTYKAMLNRLRAVDMRTPKNWAWIQTQMDVQNFVDYQFFQVYFANNDNGNIRFWRATGPEGKWRWILYDTDWGLHDPTHRTLRHITNPEGTGAMKAFSTTIWNQLKVNPEFRRLFLRRAAHHMTHTFRTERFLSEIDRLANQYAAEMERDRVRWKRKPGLWEEQVESLRRFARVRAPVVRKEIQGYFNLSDAEMDAYGLSAAPKAP